MRTLTVFACVSTFAALFSTFATPVFALDEASRAAILRDMLRPSEDSTVRRRDDRLESGLVTVFDRRGRPTYYIGRSDGVLFEAGE